jgi:hypothetical protein
VKFIATAIGAWLIFIPIDMVGHFMNASDWKTGSVKVEIGKLTIQD